MNKITSLVNKGNGETVNVVYCTHWENPFHSKNKRCETLKHRSRIQLENPFQYFIPFHLPGKHLTRCKHYNQLNRFGV